MTTGSYPTQSPFIFFGTVVSIEDPNEGGACQIRIHGLQDDENAIPDEALRWTRTMTPVTHPQLHGSGASPHCLLKGTRVMGFYLDTERQHPVIIGSVGASGDVASNTTAVQPNARTSE